VTNGWEVRPGINEHNAGNLIAYIDIQQGYIHIIRSDGQNDTLIPQILIPGNEQTTATWEKTEGLTILNGLKMASPLLTALIARSTSTWSTPLSR
jgi:hypothetical protein